LVAINDDREDERSLIKKDEYKVLISSDPDPLIQGQADFNSYFLKDKRERSKTENSRIYQQRQQ